MGSIWIFKSEVFPFLWLLLWCPCEIRKHEQHRALTGFSPSSSFSGEAANPVSCFSAASSSASRLLSLINPFFPQFLWNILFTILSIMPSLCSHPPHHLTLWASPTLCLTLPADKALHACYPEDPLTQHLDRGEWIMKNIPYLALSLFVYVLFEFDKWWDGFHTVSEASPNNNQIMRRAGLSSHIVSCRQGLARPINSAAWGGE